MTLPRLTAYHNIATVHVHVKPYFPPHGYSTFCIPYCPGTLESTFMTNFPSPSMTTITMPYRILLSVFCSFIPCNDPKSCKGHICRVNLILLVERRFSLLKSKQNLCRLGALAPVLKHDNSTVPVPVPLNTRVPSYLWQRVIIAADQDIRECARTEYGKFHCGFGLSEATHQ